MGNATCEAGASNAPLMVRSRASRSALCSGGARSVLLNTIRSANATCAPETTSAAALRAASGAHSCGFGCSCG